MNNKLLNGLALTAVAGSLAFAGCGGGDDGPSAADAQKEYTQISDGLHDFGVELGEAVNSASGKTNAQIQAEFEALANKLEGQIDDVENLDVPEDVTAAKADIVEALRDGAADIEQISSAAGTGDADAARTATRQLITDSGDIEKAQREMKAALKKAAE